MVCRLIELVGLGMNVVDNPDILIFHHNLCLLDSQLKSESILNHATLD